MKAILKSLTIFALLSLYISSCKRQELCDHSSKSNKANVKLSIDWTASGLDVYDIHNVSIYAYPEDGGDPYYTVSGDVESASINLPVGRYSILIFNDVNGDIEGVSFKDINSYDEFHVESIERSDISDLYYTPQEDEIVIYDHDPIAMWSETDIVVTAEMIKCGYCGEEYLEDGVITLDATPTPSTTPCEVTMRIENLNNAYIIRAVIRGLADGVYLVSGDRIESDEYINLYGVNFTNKVYDDNYVDGVVESQIITFGKSPSEDQSYEIEISVILNSGELVTYSRDITDQVEEQSNSKISIYLTSNENKITLPEGIGMGFGVESWGDRTTVELK